MLQLEEFAQKNQTNFTRNVRPRLQRLFPQLYKGKEGMQRLLRDIRFLKISCNGQIPPVTENDEVNLKSLIQRGKNKVSDDVGINVESPVNVLKPQAKMQESVSDDELSEIESTVDQNPSQHNYLLHNPYVNASNPYFPNLQAGNMFTVPSNFHNPLSSYVPNINLLQPSVPMYPQQFLQQSVFPNFTQTQVTQPHLQLDVAHPPAANQNNTVLAGNTSATETSINTSLRDDTSRQSLLDLASAALQQHE